VAAAAAAAAQRPFDVSQLRLWNPLSGHCVPVRDPACGLREVSKQCCRLDAYGLFAYQGIYTPAAQSMLAPQPKLCCRSA
jgi:hypothetical protein